ncbi:pentapeptide repeat-containing protein [Enterobacteriaceae bacterium YMB-R22]|uniref:pentapeptide repeat-containing protein n=1 Tax=Tenebrionicola larvae TaxID=2815733 RepID=UPI0037D9F26F|nr:pentapeptide repeat-containing protein [Tenebrionicola larvae]
MAGALVHHTTLHECDFTGASLSLAQRCHSDFSTGQLKENQLQKTLFVNGEFNEASFENLLFYKAWMSRCRFHRARLDSGFFMERTLPELYFSQATLHKITFLKSTLKNAVLPTPRG